MIEQQGRVIHLNGNEAGVQIGRSSGCSVCDQGKGCGAGIFAQLLRRKPVLVRVRNSIGARPGQLVTVGIPEKAFLSLVLRLYLLPLASALAGAAIGHHVTGRFQASAGMIDLISFFGAAVSFAVALFLCRSGGSNLPRGLNVTLCRATGMSSGGAACQKENEVQGF